MAERDLDLLLLSEPEEIFDHTRLGHRAYVTLHMLAMSKEGQLVPIIRSMESVTIKRPAKNLQRCFWRGAVEDLNEALRFAKSVIQVFRERL